MLLAADVPDDQELDPGALDTARQIIENRVNALGLTEPVVQVQGDRRIIVELPGVDDPELAIQTIRGTALLEFVDTDGIFFPPGLPIHTSVGGEPTGSSAVVLTSTLGQTGPGPFLEPAGPEYVGPVTPSVTISPTETLTATPPTTPTAPVTIYETVITGAGLAEVGLQPNQLGGYSVFFRLYDDEAAVFDGFTAAHVPFEGQEPNYPLCIVLDHIVISCPAIATRIPNGEGTISLGDASFQEAQNLVIQLSYGALPVPLRVETSSTIGPTLGEISVERSIQAGVIGLSVVLMFMLVYYRLPGFLADLALLAYALLNLALYRVVPVTLTLPGIAGFLLSAGMAVDANILVFERMKEELRAGRALRSAVEAGFSRAWTSIRDSQVSTLFVCLVLFFFGRNFGASVVKGFAITLAIGTVVNLFTAVVVTRTLVRLVVHLAGDWLSLRRWILGV